MPPASRVAVDRLVCPPFSRAHWRGGTLAAVMIGMMKIALDATPLSISSGGVRRYTEELSRALAESYPEDEFWLLSDQHFDPPRPALPNRKIGRGPRNVMERRWWL